MSAMTRAVEMVRKGVSKHKAAGLCNVSQSGDRVVADRELWHQWVSWFERHWSRLHGMISMLPGQPTDEFLEVAKQVVKDGLSGQKQPTTGAGAAATEPSRVPEPPAADGEPLYEVEQILAKRSTEGRGDEFLIKWCGFDHSENSWEPRDNLDCGAMLSDFERRWAGMSAAQRRQMTAAAADGGGSSGAAVR
ncbi:Chromo domain-containing protein cec-1 [Amphibalanus amphitrite]|uniref:Chromo domain-containing protein cec-1 n=1 Tax=Amphibalanus amphitrite TaxID=1232801 RepID=A0A6A4V077_AMPAM|nr:Chromo domain-containing protein cec-1 [Amphibalanus amphitrite]